MSYDTGRSHRENKQSSTRLTAMTIRTRRVEFGTPIFSNSGKVFSSNPPDQWRSQDSKVAAKLVKGFREHKSKFMAKSKSRASVGS